MDDFELKIASQNDAGLLQFSSPLTTVASNATVPVIVQLKNDGVLPLTSVPLRLIVDNGSPVDITWTGNLLHDSVTSVAFPAMQFAPGSRNLKAFVNWPTDLQYWNDTIVNTIESILTTPPPYSDNFDAAFNPWIATVDGLQGTSWEHGTPVYGQTVSAHSLPQCWDINLTTAYNNLAIACLYSPVFDLTALGAVDISFWLNYNTEFGADGTILEYSLDDVNWQQLGTGSDPEGTNWFNTTFAGGQQGWSGSTAGWVQSRYYTWGFTGQPFFRLRFKFISDFNVTLDGVLMDDFSISAYTGLNENTDLPFNIYPNPVHDYLYMSELPNDKCILSITDVSGRELYQESVNGNSHRIDMQSYSAGTYIVRVRNERLDHSVRIVKF